LKSIMVAICLIILILITAVPSVAQEKLSPLENVPKFSQEKRNQLFEMQIPEGFKPEPSDEPGIEKWKKNSAEIYAVYGEIFANSSDSLFKAIREKAKADKRTEEIRNIRVKGGKAFLYKEKNPEDPNRPKAWRLFVITNNKMINIDFIAPSKDFNSFKPAFEIALKSFKLKIS